MLISKKIILDFPGYSGRPDIITRVPKSEKGWQKSQKEM